MRRERGRVMKRALAVACAAFFCVAGCGRKAELTFHVGGAPNEIAYWEEIVREFQDATGISVVLLRSTTQTEQRKQSILIALRGKKADPDVMLMDVAWIGQMASSGWLEPLDGLDRGAFFPRIIDLADTHDGHLVGVPVYVDGGLLYYRADLLKKYGFDGPPETWLDLLAMATAVQKGERETNPDFWGYVWQGAQYEGLVCNALEVFVSAGGGFLDEATAPVIHSEPNVKALRFMADLIGMEGVSPPNTYTDMKEEEVRLLFQSGNALFERNWPYAWALHGADDSEVKGKFGIAPLPHFEGHAGASTLGGWHVAVSACSDRKTDAVRFVEFVTSRDVQKKLAMKLGWNPGRPDVYEDEELTAAYPALQDLRRIFENAVPRPSVPYYSQISTILQKHFNAVLAGKAEAETALRAAQEEVAAVVREYGK
jgi:multiple sugar transport system substrate-binding protein